MDLKDEKLYERYILNQLQGEEKEIFYERLSSDNKFKEDYFKFKDLFDEKQHSENSKNYSESDEWEILSEKINVGKKRSKLRLMPYWYAAAVVVVAFLIGFYSGNYSDNSQDKFYSFYSPKGQRSFVKLPDGSEVWLNADSRINISSEFDDKNRSLKLEGEAFFKVKKSDSKCFEVISGDQKVKVLGTEFNIKAYSDDNIIETTLKEGLIELYTENSIEKLTPNEQIVYNRANKKIIRRKVDSRYYTSWINGRIMYTNAKLEELVKIIELWYDYEVIYSQEELKDIRFTGVVKHDKTVDYLLNLVKHIAGIKYEIKEDKIYITK